MERELKPYKKLMAWQRGYELVLSVYRLTESFPKEERFGLTSQLRRASVSVIANIVEGSAKKSQNDFSRFLDIAKGSLWETECLLELARDLKYLKKDDYEFLEDIRAKTAYLLHRLSHSLRNPCNT